jgi:hypothetical protein
MSWKAAEVLGSEAAFSDRVSAWVSGSVAAEALKTEAGWFVLFDAGEWVGVSHHNPLSMYNEHQTRRSHSDM